MIAVGLSSFSIC